jgi:hypothetical protein
MWVHDPTPIDLENSHCLAGQAADFSARFCSAGARSVASSGTTTASASLRSECKTDGSTNAPSGTTCARLTDAPGEVMLTCSQPDSRVRRSAARETTQPSTCGPTPPELLARYDHQSHFWKTSQGCFPSLTATLGVYSETYPRWGTMRRGQLYRHPPQVLPTNETDSGYSLATPTKTANQNSPSMRKHPGCVRFQDLFGRGPIHPRAYQWMMGWPIEWTALQPLETDKCRSKWLLRGRCLVAAWLERWTD